MKVLFQNPGMDYLVNSIMMFQKEDESSFWSEPLFHFYPQLDKAYVFKLSPREKSEYIRDTLISVYRDQESTINYKVDIVALNKTCHSKFICNIKFRYIGCKYFKIVMAGELQLQLSA